MLNLQNILENSGPQNVHERTKEIQRLQLKTFSTFFELYQRFSNFEPVVHNLY